MKINLSIPFLVLFLMTLPLQAQSTVETSDVKHFGVSALLGYAFGYGVEKYTQDDEHPKSDLFKVSVSTSLALSIGIAKEIYDSQEPNNHFSGKDLAFDFTGSLVGALLSNYIHRKNKDFTVLVTPTQPTQMTLVYHF